MATKLLENLIGLAREKGASDLHLDAGISPHLRVRGDLERIGDPISVHALEDLVRDLLGRQWDDFLIQKSSDFSKTLGGVRCRFNVFQSVRGLSLSVRLLSSFRGGFKEFNLHPDLKRILNAETGLVLISGATGSGKSTTLAAFIEEINTVKRANIITVEKPIEYYFHNRQSLIRQREVPKHSPTFEQALMDSMREDPDVLVIGEMREAEVMRLTVNAAETGHLVFGTLHSSNCAEALTRLCASFPSEIQSTVRAQVADCLVAVICQRMHFIPAQNRVVPWLEILVANSAVKNCIRNGNFGHILSCIQTGAEDGMYTFERYKLWIDQKRDWFNPSTSPILRAESDDPIELESLRSARYSTRHLTSDATTAPFNSPARRKGLIERGAREQHPHDEGRIEIGGNYADLEALARKIAGEDGDTE